MKEKAQKKKIHFEIFPVLIFVATLFMSIVYAQISDVKLEIAGTVDATPQEGVFISNISKTSSTGVISEEIKYYKGTTLSSSIELSTDSSSAITYNIFLYNNSGEEYYFKGVSYDTAGYSNKNITYVLDGLEKYVTTIEANKQLDFTIQFKYSDREPIQLISQVLNSLLKFEFSNEMIEFKVADTTYASPKGATWKQFVESKYNTYGFSITDGKVYTPTGEQVYNLYTEIKSTNVIIENKDYNYKPELTLDKESIEVEIEEGTTATEILTATLTNVEGELTWTSSDTDVAEVVGNGNTATVTIKAEGTVDITVSYGTISATCTVDVGVKGKIKVGQYVNYDVSYDDIYNSTSTATKTFGKTDGWRYLGTDNDGNHLLISTGVPMILRYYYLLGFDDTPQWWDTTQTNTNAKMAEGLKKNLAKIPYTKVSAGTTSPSNTNTMIGLFGDSNRTTVGDYFKVTGKSYSNSITVRTLTLAELNRAVNSANAGVKGYTQRSETSISAGFKNLTGDALGLFDLSDLDLSNNYYYWLSTPYENDDDYVYFISNGTDYVTSNRIDESRGIRPVIVLSPDIQFKKVDGVWYIPSLELDKNVIESAIIGGTATETLTAILEEVEGELTWTSSDTDVAEVVGSGNTATVTIKAGGTATITVSCGELSATCTVNVTEDNLISFTVNGTTYTAEQGMTWQDWVGSAYDTSNGLFSTYTLPSGSVVVSIR